jgi:hypothetical protein
MLANGGVNFLSARGAEISGCRETFARPGRHHTVDGRQGKIPVLNLRLTNAWAYRGHMIRAIEVSPMISPVV